MSHLRLTAKLGLLYLSRPAVDRLIYRAVVRHQPRRIVEIGVQLGVRSERLLKLAACYHDVESLSYVGVDEFEARPAAQAGTTLKRAHRILGRLAGCVRLAPGDALSGIRRVANCVSDVDLLIISADQDPAALAKAWFYLPRMLHDSSMVLEQSPGGDYRRSPFRVAPASGWLARAEAARPTTVSRRAA